MDKTHTVHKIDFLRAGECSRCGECCFKWNCRHLSMDAEGLRVCDVQGRKRDFCKECTEDPDGSFYQQGAPVDHAVCAEFPNHPWLNLIKDGICSYQFQRLNETGDPDSKPLPFQDLAKDK